MVQVVWNRLALASVVAIRAYISEFNGPAAERIAQRFKRAAGSLGENPNRGRLVRDAIRELIVVSPYVIRYRIEPGRVINLRIRHGARRPD